MFQRGYFKGVSRGGACVRVWQDEGGGSTVTNWGKRVGQRNFPRPFGWWVFVLFLFFAFCLTLAGWFIEFPTKGTPKQLDISSLQIMPQSKVMVAIPYRVGTSFSISLIAASWCNTQWAICTKPLRLVSSVAAVRNGFGDVYFYNSTSKLLHIRLVHPADSGRNFFFLSDRVLCLTS